MLTHFHILSNIFLEEVSLSKVTKAKEVLALLEECMAGAGFLTIRTKGSNKPKFNDLKNPEGKKAEIKKCRIVNISQKQQAYVLVTEINSTKARKLSLGEGTQVMQVEIGNKKMTFSSGISLKGN